MRVVVSIPAFNEEKTLGRVIQDVRRVMDSTNHRYSIMVVNDGSRDRTADIASSLGAIVYSHPINFGLAEAFRTEIQKFLDLNYDVLVHIDADGQYLASDIPRLLAEIEKGYDLVLGSRFKGRIEYMPFINRAGNIAFSEVVSHISGMRITDAQTGFRAFTREVAEKIKIISNHTYTQEQIIRAVRGKLRIKEVPVYFARRHGKSRLISNPFGYAMRAWVNIFRIYRDFEPLKFFGWVGAFFLFFAFLLGLWFTYLHLTTGIQGHLGLFFLMVILFMTGIQIVLFGFLADMRR
jgi:glycosyltransferase involved in cell wall biosynthesis